MRVQKLYSHLGTLGMVMQVPLSEQGASPVLHMCRTSYGHSLASAQQINPCLIHDS